MNYRGDFAQGDPATWTTQNSHNDNTMVNRDTPFIGNERAGSASPPNSSRGPSPPPYEGCWPMQMDDHRSNHHEDGDDESWSGITTSEADHNESNNADDEQGDSTNDEDNGIGDETNDEDDLFANTFGKKQSTASMSRSPSPVSSSDSGFAPLEPPQSIERTTSRSPDHPRPSSYGYSPDEHTAPCTDHTHRSSTPPIPSEHPPPAPRPSHSRPLPKPKTNHIPLAPLLQKQTTFHARALHLIPALPLAPHRFWIGILHIGKRTHLGTTTTPSSATSGGGGGGASERDFVWLKGNRHTTVRTLTHAYATVAARPEGEVELRLEGFGAVGARESLRELELFADKKVFFRAVEVGGRGGGGGGGKGVGERAWEVSRGLVPVEGLASVDGGKRVEVIELD